MRFLESYKNTEDSAYAYTTVHLNITHWSYWQIIKNVSEAKILHQL